MRHKAFLLLFLIFSFVSFFSCSDNSPDVASLSAMTVIEFKDGSSLPSMRLSLFAQTLSDIQRAKSLKVVSNQTGLSWYCSDIIKFRENNKKNWAGSTKLIPLEGSLIPEGSYSVIYTDSAGEKWEGSFNVKYSAEYMDKKSSDFPDCIKTSKSERIAVYSSEGKLIYFGEKKKSWTDISKIKNDIQSAFSFRVCYYVSAENLMIIMPEEKASENISE